MRYRISYGDRLPDMKLKKISKADSAAAIDAIGKIKSQLDGNTFAKKSVKMPKDAGMREEDWEGKTKLGGTWRKQGIKLGCIISRKEC